MRTLPLLLALVAAGCTGTRETVAPVQPAVDTAALAAEAEVVAGQLGSRLKGELMTAMQAGGPLAAIDTCHLQAQPLTADTGAASGWQVGRTSLRLRNPANAPDGWERSVLDDFAARVAAGEAPATLSAQTVAATADGGREFRYMKAIATQESCTVCHGAAIAPPIQARLRVLYPDDRATGFSAGELRGAFTLSKRID